MSANDRQVGGDHYGKGPIKHWDLVELYNWDYFQAMIIKYVMRWQDKGGIQDLEKAAHFLEKYMEIAKQREVFLQAKKAGAEPLPHGYVNQE